MLLLVLCQSQQVLATGGISLFLPLIRWDVGLDFTQGGTLAAASTLVYALMQIPAGYLADRGALRSLLSPGGQTRRAGPLRAGRAVCNRKM